MTDTTNLTTTIPRATLNRVDLDSALISVSLPYVDVNGAVQGDVNLNVEVMISDARFTPQQRTSLKNGLKMIGQVTGVLA